MNILKKIILSFCIILLIFSILQSQSIQTRGRITNSVYVYDDTLQKANVDASTGATESKHVRLYQYLRFRAKAKEWNNLSLNVAARALSDLNPDTEIDSDRRFNAYTLSIGMKNVFSFMDFELGRQFLHPGIVLGSIDGLNLKLRPIENLNWQIYGGSESHLFRSLEIYKPDNALVLGTSLKYKNFSNNDLQLVYLQKSRAGENQWQVSGLNWQNYMVKNLTLLMQGHYDLVNSRFHRIYLSTRYKWNNSISLGGSFKQQYPQVYGDSYFKIFEISQYRLSSVDAAYAITDRYTVSAAFQSIMLEEGYGNRAILNFSDPNGSIGILYEYGDLGDQIGILMGYGYEFMPDLTASVSLDYSRYRFEEVYEYDSQLANAARLAYRFSRHWRADVEYQWLTNRMKDSDQRILNHIHFIW